jgi:hypothetical protein
VIIPKNTHNLVSFLPLLTIKELEEYDLVILLYMDDIVLLIFDRAFPCVSNSLLMFLVFDSISLDILITLCQLCCSCWRLLMLRPKSAPPTLNVSVFDNDK